MDSHLYFDGSVGLLNIGLSFCVADFCKISFYFIIISVQILKMELTIRYYYELLGLKELYHWKIQIIHMGGSQIFQHIFYIIRKIAKKPIWCMP